MSDDNYRDYLFDNLRELLDRARRARDDSRKFHDTLATVAFQQGARWLTTRSSRISSTSSLDSRSIGRPSAYPRRSTQSETCSHSATPILIWH